MTDPSPPKPGPPPLDAAARARFRPHERVKRPDDFRRAFGRKRAVSDAALVVHAAENRLDHPRLGISVPRKVARRATARNRLKRVIREAFRLSKAALPAGVDLIVVPRDPKLSLEQARHSLRTLARDAARRVGRPPATRPPASP
jgi:ribonuclease P protein component